MSDAEAKTSTSFQCNPIVVGDWMYVTTLKNTYAVDARTGELKNYRQFVENDFHDWDIAASPSLFASQAGRKMAGVAGKDGYFYGLSRDLREQHYQT